jgi:tellurite resistance-related uncharacterized protein
MASFLLKRFGSVFGMAASDVDDYDDVDGDGDGGGIGGPLHPLITLMFWLCPLLLLTFLVAAFFPRNWRLPKFGGPAVSASSRPQAATIEQLPPYAVSSKRLPPEGVFTADTIPKGLFMRHTTKAGVWAEVTVVRGLVRVNVMEGGNAEIVDLHGGGEGGDAVAVVAPQVGHEIKLLSDDIELSMRLFSVPDTEDHSKID